MKETIEDLLKKRNGYLHTSDVVAAGISKSCLAKYVRENGLLHVAHGVYLSEDAWKDDYYITSLTSRKIIYQVKRELYEIGRSTAMALFGNEVPVYDRERTVCDTILSRNNMDSQAYQTAIKDYMESSRKDVNNP